MIGSLCAPFALGCVDAVNWTESEGLPLLATPSENPLAEVDDGAPNRWPGWRGGQAGGVAAGGAAPRRWSETEGIRWQTRVPGRGNSSPVVWDDCVLLTSIVESNSQAQAALYCFDRETGRRRWSRALAAPIGPTHGKNGYASATVATDGRRVFAAFGSLGVFCHDIEGRSLWHQPLEAAAHKWGAASSPVLFGELVVMVLDGEEASRIVALDAATGSLVWQTPRESTGCWSTPALIAVDGPDGVRFELIVNGTGSIDGSPGLVIAYDPYSGTPLWHARGTTDIPVPTPIVADGLIVCSSGGDGPIMALRPGGFGDVTESHTAWRHASGGPYVPTGVAYQGRLFTITDGGVATAHTLPDGQPVWQKRLHGTFAASLVAADGCIYATSEQGDVHVFEAATDRFELIATNRMRQPCLATPAVTGGRIYLRTETQLVCIEGIPEPQPVVASDDVPTVATEPESPSDRVSDADGTLINADQH